MSRKKKYTNWRLPTIQELFTLINHNKINPACDLKDTDASGYYWSTTTDASRTSYAWGVGFNYGYSGGYNKTGSNYVRCVRTSKKGKLRWSASSNIEMTWDEAKKYAKKLKAPIYYKG